MATPPKSRKLFSFFPVLVMSVLFMAGAWLPATALPSGEGADTPQREGAAPNLPVRVGGRPQPVLAHALPDDLFMLPPRALDLAEDQLVLLAQLADEHPELVQEAAALGPALSPDLLRVWIQLQTIAAGQQGEADEARNNRPGGPDRDPMGGTAPV